MILHMNLRLETIVFCKVSDLQLRDSRNIRLRLHRYFQAKWIFPELSPLLEHLKWAKQN